ncbi:26559_t:CDS:2 [Gigaspora margarita]|uniref:26559_t:CDS:1 n=1 Tax=Gigaspora margarita TaxID=4874 RepID=A0ABN7UAG9_GIGMA|nr:26559_t:CDS:2 [Gigaspora margarita]
MINMIALVKKDPKINKKDVTISITAKNYINQKDIYIDMICYHLIFVQCLINVTIVVKHSVVYMNRELIITDKNKNTQDKKMIQLRTMSQLKITHLANKILNEALNSNTSNPTVYE